MHTKRRRDCELPRQSCRLGGACVDFFFTRVLRWFCLELPRKGCASGGGIRDARVKVNPVNWLTPEAQDPETQPHFGLFSGSDTCTAFHWDSPTKEIFAHGICFTIAVRALDSHPSYSRET